MSTVIDKLYEKETNFLARKTIGLTIVWLEMPRIIKVQTAPLRANELDMAYDKLKAGLFPKLERNFEKTAAQKIFDELLQKVQVKGNNMMAPPINRLVVCITTLRQYYPEELGDWGGGGRKLKNEERNKNPLSTSLRRR